MFNFFKKTTEDVNNDENDIIASISYVIKRGDKKAHIDISLDDYENESIDALCSLLDILGEDGFYIDTINMIKSCLIKDGKADVLIKLLSGVESKIQKKILNSAKERIKNEPYIKPSEIFR